MKRKTKIAIGVGAVVALGLVSYLLYQRKKGNESKNSGVREFGFLPDGTYGMDYITAGNAVTGHAVHLTNRPKKGALQEGDDVIVDGTSFDGSYRVNEVWIDSKGRVGAVYLNIRYTPKGDKDLSYKGEGTIKKLQ